MIHPTAVIDPSAQLHEDVEVGPYAIIGAEVTIGRGCRIGPHALVRGPTVLGEDNQIFQFASVGEDPQDKKYGGERTWLIIGQRNIIRESATVHRGTAQGGGVTRLGNDNLLMAYTHVAHDCQLGNHVILANAASLGGHIEVQDWAILGGFTIVHQFCRLGAHCFTAMGSVISQDVPPYVMVSGHPATVYGLNREGLRRRQFTTETIRLLHHAYRLLYRSNLRLEDALTAMDALAPAPELQVFTDFLRQRSRGILR